MGNTEVGEVEKDKRGKKVRLINVSGHLISVVVLE